MRLPYGLWPFHFLSLIETTNKGVDAADKFRH